MKYTEKAIEIPQIDEIDGWISLRKAAHILGTTEINVRKLVHKRRIKAQRWESQALMLDRSSVELYRDTPHGPGRPSTKDK